MSGPDLSVLTRYSTPTVANAIELFEIRPRDQGFLKPGLCCLQPELPPVAGFVATCLVSGNHLATYGRRDVSDYWKHLESLPGPRISVVQDLDPRPGSGCFWGEVNANIHLALGCVATVTDGAVRDLPEMRAAGFQALYRHVAVSHGYIHVAGFGDPVNIDGVVVAPGDVIQVDQHGALLVPIETLPHLEQAVREIERRERPVIEYAQSGSATRQGLAERVARMRSAGPWRPGETPTGS